MARTPDARETGTTLVGSEDTALSLDPNAAPLLRKATPEIDEKPMTRAQQITTGVFVFAPMLALLAAIPFAWGWGLGWHDIVIGAVFYWVSGLGITVGYHRYFTHSSFKAKTGLRVALAIAGSLAMEGPVVTWVADHRRHHKYSDKEGDPHSPWRYGDDAKALAKGLALGARAVAVRPQPDLAGEVRTRPARRPQHPQGRRLVPRDRRVHAPRPGADRRLLDLRDLVLARRDRPRSSGPAWSGSRCCTTSPGRSTPSATPGATPTGSPATAR